MVETSDAFGNVTLDDALVNSDNNDNANNSNELSKGRKVKKTLSKLMQMQAVVPKCGRGRSRVTNDHYNYDNENGNGNDNNNDTNDGSYKPPTPTRSRKTESSSSSDNYLALKGSRTLREERKRQARHHRKNVQRYRGFSTSISSLFLDEQVVCGAVSWCGLLASSRTEYLLDVRNEQLRIARTNQNQENNKSPSKVLGFLLVASVSFISLTYLIWGFGEVNGGGDGDGEYNYKYYGRNLELEPDSTLESAVAATSGNIYEEASKHYIPGVMRLCDYDRRFWSPFYSLIWSMVKVNDSQSTPSSILNSEESYYEHANQHQSNRRLSTWIDDQELAANLRFIVCMIFLVVLGLFGRRRRMRARFSVLKARAQDDQIQFGGFKTDDREDKYSGACSHTLCGCYPIDRKISLKKGREVNNEEDEIEIAPGVKKKNEDSINAAFSSFMGCCFGRLCKLWCQWFSICALAQEAREVRLLVPPKLQRVDFITHQPWSEYFTDIYDLRLGWKEKSRGVKKRLGSNFGALSTLSRSIVVTFIISTLVIIVTEQINPRAVFSWADACVLIMTFVQSFIVLGVVHGLFHKSDLSLDAVIKFFAAGFIIATPTAFLFETIIISIFACFYYIVDLVVTVITGGALQSFDGIYVRLFLLFCDILQAFLVAALVEELCKYYAFRTIEHPDLIFLTGLDRVKRDQYASLGGSGAYSFSSDNNALVRADTFESGYSRPSNSRRPYRGNHSRSPSMSRRSRKNKTDNKSEQDVRTVRQKAAAVTTAMISVAVGLACAENFIYVFFLSGSNTQEEIAMLLFRSIFPVHALCAAMQSIGVIRKFLEEGDENQKSIGVGSIVLPAIILHGSFDSVLMIINTLIDFAVENAQNQGGNQDYDFILLNLIAGVAVLSAMFSGLFWYYMKNRTQKAKLKLLETVSSADDTTNSNVGEKSALELL